MPYVYAVLACYLVIVFTNDAKLDILSKILILWEKYVYFGNIIFHTFFLINKLKTHLFCGSNFRFDAI